MALISTYARAIEFAELKQKEQAPSKVPCRIEDHPLYESVLAWENASREKAEEDEKASIRKREERAARALLAGKT
jgi:hypothetical protein